MTPKITKLFDELEEGLRLADLILFADRVAFIKKSLTPAPKKVTPKINAVALKLEITENGKTSEVIFEDEKKAEAFLKLKQKQRLSSHRNPEGLTVPCFDFYGGTYASKIEEYNKGCAAYWIASDEQNLSFTVKITRA